LTKHFFLLNEIMREFGFNDVTLRERTLYTVIPRYPLSRHPPVMIRICPQMTSHIFGYFFTHPPFIVTLFSIMAVYLSSQNHLSLLSKGFQVIYRLTFLRGRLMIVNKVSKKLKKRKKRNRNPQVRISRE